MKKANSNAKLFTSSSLDEADANPPHSPGRLGYRSIPPAALRQSPREEELVPDSSLQSNSILQREGSTTSLHSNDSSDSLEGKKIQGNHMENSPSITSSGYHSDELHASETVGVNGGNSPPRVLGPASLSLSSPSSSSVSGYDATRYQDETSSEATLPSVRVLIGPLFSHAQKYLTTFKLRRVYSNYILY